MAGMVLVDGSIPFSPRLSQVFGVCGALLLQQVFYWCEINKEKGKHFHEGNYWCYNTHKGWEDQLLGAFKTRTIRRELGLLLSSGVLVMGNFNKAPYDQTRWYRVDRNKLKTLLDSHVAKLATGGDGGQNCQPPMAKIAAPIPETIKPQNTTKGSGFAKPKTEETMLPKNGIKKGPTNIHDVVGRLSSPESKSMTLIQSLYHVWVVNVPKRHPSVKFLGPFTMKQKGQVKQFSKGLPCAPEAVLLFVIENWSKFGKLVKSSTELKSYPESPNLDFLLKHKNIAVSLYLSKESSKDADVGSPVADICTEPVKPKGKVVIIKKPIIDIQEPKKESKEDSVASLEFVLNYPT